jgi:DNA-binding protein YbaB
MTMIDSKKKEYSVITPQDLAAMQAKLQEQMQKAQPQMQKMQEQMKNMPPEVRARMEKMMGGAAASLNVQKGPGSRTIAGYACDEWTLSMGEMSKTEQCLTTALPIPMQAWGRYREVADNLKNMMSAMGPMAKGLQDAQEKMKQMQGVPLASKTTTSVLGRTSVSSTEVTEIRKGPIPASAWAIPPDYKKVESPMAKALQAK